MRGAFMFAQYWRTVMRPNFRIPGGGYFHYGHRGWDMGTGFMFISTPMWMAMGGLSLGYVLDRSSLRGASHNNWDVVAKAIFAMWIISEFSDRVLRPPKRRRGEEWLADDGHFPG